MVVAAARYGYGETSVARIVARAGVSRATFYANFSDKDDCFRAAYSQIAAPVWQDLERLAAADADSDRLRQIVGALLARAGRYPAATKVFLLEAFAAEPSVRAEHERLLLAVEQAIDAQLGESGEDGVRIEVPARAVLGGLAGIIGIRAFRREAGDLASLTDDLMAWLQGYGVGADHRHRSQAEWTSLGRRFAATRRQGDEAPRTLPRGRSALPPAVVASEQRGRILDAVGAMAREKGYAATTVADVVAEAGVTREVFYEQFRGKADAFLAAQGRGLEESLGLAGGEYFSDGSWPDRVWRAGSAMLSYTADHPDNAYVETVESYATGSAAIQRAFENRMAYTFFLEEGYRQRPAAESLPKLCSEAIAGGLIELLRRQVALDRVEQVLELVPQGAYITLAPFIGAPEAAEFVEAKVAETGCD